MSLKEKLMEDLKTSMKNKNTVRKNAITMIRAAIKQAEVDRRIELNDEEILEIISKQVKEKKNALEDFKKGQRQDLVDLTEQEIEILLEYLPKQLTDEELKEIVVETINEVKAKDIKDMGKIMKSIMPKIKGRADGSRVNEVVRQVLK
ncbi:GatB/YqeY domain-containing protein [Tepidimicrobium xylanilyticum]|uniref:GatB/YqeY domain-containing protein n=1 Tax=Tepidimicrobium xylanilyticum TaxID=1123352 RepID=UPI00264CF44D|nr:GatB/YqeY domain-containing protein [Tepidimicrobium xylanilyticum]GMG96037.1 aspartyl-tRNA amidotransferase subunit B [Tepidimicrobium xylanilyticum]